MHRIATIVASLMIASMSQGQVTPSAAEVSSYQGLHRAAHDGDIEEIIRLVASGADIDWRDKHGRTPAHIAAFASQDEALRTLAKAGADMNALEHQAYDVVTIAAVANDPDLMGLAIELGNAPDLTTSPYDGTALIAAAHLGHVEIVRRLINAGAPLDHINNLHWTALMEAVVLGDGGPNYVKVVRLLVDAGADIEIPDRNQITPLEHARSRKYAEIAQLLAPED